MPYEMLCTAYSPEFGGRVYFGDTGNVVGRSCDGADGRALAVYVISPELGVFDQLLRLNPSLVQGHGEVNLNFGVRTGLYLFGDGRLRERKLTESSPNSLQS